MRRLLRGVSLGGLLVLLTAHAATAAGHPAYAPLDQPGPPLTVPLPKLQGALSCQATVVGARTEPVLLNPATGVTPDENYSWNWEPALDKLGIPWCAYTAPHSTLDNIETSGEYLVYAIRAVYGLAGQPIAVMGHSQGGMSMRWALRFWPDTRRMVADVIGFSGTNHGTTVFSPAQCFAGCPPAAWQQGYESSFIRALNSHAETFAGISYTEIYTHTDELVDPNSGPNASAALHTGQGAITNVATQNVCPNDLYEHLAVGTVDPVAYALAVDALTHPGPADPARVGRESKSLCTQLYMPGVNPVSANLYLQIIAAQPGLQSVALGALANATTGAPELKAEPPLTCYVFARCSGAAAPTLEITGPRRLRAGHATRVRILVAAKEGDAFAPVPGAAVSVAGHRAITNASGAATFTVRMKRSGVYRISAVRQGCNSAVRLLRVAR